MGHHRKDWVVGYLVEKEPGWITGGGEVWHTKVAFFKRLEF